MKYANVNILPVTAHHGMHETVFSTKAPADDSALDGAGTFTARLTRGSTMDTWLPVLACVCSTDITPGDFMIAGPDADEEDVESQLEDGSEGGAVSTGVGDPETVDLATLRGVEISDEAIQMVWEQCHQAVANYMPQKGS